MPALLCVSFVRRFIFILFILLSIHSIYLLVLSSVVPYLPERESFSLSCRCATACSVPQPSRSHHPAWLAISVCSYPVLVHIHLDDADSVTRHFLHLLQDGVHNLAWLAPCGKEIDQPTHEARAEESSLDYALQEGGRRSQNKLVI